jgi:hypothetical protein
MVMYELYNQVKKINTNSLEPQIKMDIKRTLKLFKDAEDVNDALNFRHARQSQNLTSCDLIQKRMREIPKEILNNQNMIGNVAQKVQRYKLELIYFEGLHSSVLNNQTSLGIDVTVLQKLISSLQDLICIATDSINQAKTNVQDLQMQFEKYNADWITLCSPKCGKLKLICFSFLYMYSLTKCHCGFILSVLKNHQEPSYLTALTSLPTNLKQLLLPVELHGVTTLMNMWDTETI